MTEDNIKVIEKMKSWARLLTHIRKLNEQGYRDHEVKDLKANFGFGWFHNEWEWVIVSVTDEHEICLTGWKTEKSVREALKPENKEGYWEVESVWHNNKQCEYKTEVILTVPDDDEEEEDYSDHICAELGCENAPETGYIVCVQHHYGFPSKANAKAIEWKQKQKGEIEFRKREKEFQIAELDAKYGVKKC